MNSCAPCEIFLRLPLVPCRRVAFPPNKELACTAFDPHVKHSFDLVFFLTFLVTVDLWALDILQGVAPAVLRRAFRSETWKTL